MTNWMREVSLKTKLVASFGTILMVVVGVLVWYSSWRQAEQSKRELRSKALAITNLVAQDVAAGYEFGDTASVLAVFGGARTHSGATSLVLYKPDGTPFAASDGAELLPREQAAALAGETSAEDSQNALRVRAPVSGSGGTKGRLVVAFDKTDSERQRHDYQRTALFIGLLMLGVGLVVAWIIGEYVARRIRSLGRIITRFAEGDLTALVTDGGGDEVGRLVRSVDAMRTSLCELVSQIKKSSVEIGSSSLEIFASTRQQEQAATQQASAIEETRRTMDSLLTSSRAIAESAEAVLHNAEMTFRNNKLIAERYEQLSVHLQRITEILEVIRGIANKSDLLALNASLEGTKAGEAGRGFSLVAAQMQRLAENVMDSVQDIKKLMGDIREASHAAAIATEEGARLAEQTTSSARQIRLITHQQQGGTEQVTQSMNDASDHLAQTTTGMKQIASAMKSLTDLSVQLNEAVKAFRIAE